MKNFQAGTDVHDSARLLSKDLSEQYRELLGRERILEFLTQELNQNTKHLMQLMKMFAVREGNAEEIVKNFCLFSLLFSKLYVPCTYWIWNELADNENESINIQDDSFLRLSNPASFLDYVIEGNDTHERILKFLGFMGIEDHDAGDTERDRTEYARMTLKQRAGEMYDKLDSAIKLSYKKYTRQAFAETSAAGNNSNNESDRNSTRELENTICKLIEKKFGDYISINSTDDITYRHIRLLESSVYTKSLAGYLKNDINLMAHTAYINLLLACIQELIHRGNLQYIRDYSDFFGSRDDSAAKSASEKLREADKNYLALLEEKGFNLMLGSKYLLSNRDFYTSDTFNDRTKNYKWITADGAFLGAAMRSREIHFYIRGIRAHTDNAALEDIAHKVRKTDSGIYEYEAVEGVMIPFNSEDELRDYAAEEKKIIRVDAELGIDTSARCVSGIYFSKR